MPPWPGVEILVTVCPRRKLASCLATVVAIAVTAGAVGACGTAAAARRNVPRAHTGAAAPAPGSATTRVDVASRNRPRVVPRSFLGISTEYWTIPIWAQHIDLLSRVFSMITQEGPVILRIGGNSADQSVWSPSKEQPEWLFELTPAWLAQVRQIVLRLHVKLILDLNLLSATPAQAARWASTAERSLPAGSIIGFEMGNEPDIYNPALVPAGVKAAPRMTAQSYARAYAAFDRALDRSVPNIPLMGPALAEPQKNVSWISTLLRSPHHGLTAITAHRYPLSACVHSGPMFPTVSGLLSEHATAGMAATLTQALELSRRARLPLRLTEFNSITCGGVSGISDTFATSLWAPDALLELIHAGVQSAALHVRARAVNMAFSLTSSGLQAFPLLYGLVVYARTLGRDPQLLPASVRRHKGSHLKTWVILDGHQLRVLLINKGTQPERVALSLPAVGAAAVQRLLAPSVKSSANITLAGQVLDASGRWSGRRSLETIAGAGGRYTLSVPAMSAAIVSTTARPGTT